MSIELMAQAWKQKGLSGTEKLILLALCDYADADNQCWPSQTTIANKCDCSRRYVNQTVQKLEGKGLIKKTQMFKANKQLVNMYRITLGKGGENTVPRGWEHSSQGVGTGVLTEPSIEPPIKESSNEVVQEILTDQQRGFGAVCQVLGFDSKTLTKADTGMVAQTWGILNKAGYSPAQIVRWYEEVWKKDWRYRNGTIHPTVKTLRAEIGKLQSLDAPQRVTVVSVADNDNDTPW